VDLAIWLNLTPLHGNVWTLNHITGTDVFLVNAKNGEVRNVVFAMAYGYRQIADWQTGIYLVSNIDHMPPIEDAARAAGIDVAATYAANTFPDSDVVQSSLKANIAFVVTPTQPTPPTITPVVAYEYPAYLVDGVINGALDLINKTTGDIRAVVLQLVDGQVKMVDVFSNTIVNTTEAELEKAYTLIEQAGLTVQDGIATDLGFVEGTTQRISDTVVAPIQSVVDKAEGFLSDIISTVKGTLDSAVDEAGHIIASITTSVGDTLVVTLDEAGHILDSVWKDAKAAADNVATTALNFAGQFALSLPTLVETSISDIASKLPGSLDALTNGLTGSGSPLSVFGDIGDGFKMLSQFARILPKITEAVDAIQKVDKFTASPILTDVARVLVGVCGEFGAIIGSPAGLLPFIGDSYAAGIGELVKKEARSTYLPAVIDESSALDAKLRGIISDSEFTEISYSNGLRDEQQAILVKLRKYMFGIGDLGTLYLRGAIADDEFASRLSQLGVDAPDVDNIKMLIHPLPGIQDIMAMAERYAFTPDVAKQYGLYDDFPDDVNTYAQQNGISTEWAQRYWASHWQLPSIQMGFDMFQRGIITSDDLSMLLRTAGIVPYWREKLMALSYTLISRIDIRRMYKMGIYDYDKVYASYIKLGYNTTDAKDLADFCIKDVAGEIVNEKKAQRDLTRADILNIYDDALLSRDDTLKMMLDLGYSNDEAEMLLSLEDAKLQQKLQNKAIELLKAYCINGDLTLNDAQDKFNAMGLTANEVAYHIMDLNLSLYKKGLKVSAANA